jgi:hypothetical protein
LGKHDIGIKAVCVDILSTEMPSLQSAQLKSKKKTGPPLLKTNPSELDVQYCAVFFYMQQVATL